MPVYTGQVPLSFNAVAVLDRDVGKHKLTFLGHFQLIFRMNSHGSQLFIFEGSWWRFHATVPGSALNLDWTSTLGEVYLLELNLNSQIFVSIFETLSTVILEEIIYLLEGWHFEFVATKHFDDEVGEPIVSTVLQDLSLGMLSNVLNVLFILLFSLYLFLFFACQQPIDDKTQLEHQAPLVLIRHKVSLFLFITD